MTNEFSAGGVVYKKEGQTIFILVAQHSQHHGWVFPKGHIDPGETKEEAALREVKEEAGAIGEIISPLTPVAYWYKWAKEKREKTVYYYLMHYISGDISQHDFEMENVEWLEANEVENKLTYPSDKKVWREAQKLIK